MTPMDATYEDCEERIQKIVGRFIKERGMIEDIQQEAAVGFLKAYYTRNPAKGKFSTWLNTKVYYHLLEQKERAAQKARMAPKESMDLEQLPEPEGFDLFRLLLELSPDAETMVKLVLDKSLKRKDLLFKILRKQGWSKLRISQTIQEVKEALAS